MFNSLFKTIFFAFSCCFWSPTFSERCCCSTSALLLIDRVTFHSRRPAWKKRVCRSIGQIGGNYCATTLHKSKSKNTSIFKKNYMFMAQRFWIIWIRPLNCTWKTEQMLEITAKVATKSVDSPLIKLWTVNRKSKITIIIYILQK